MTVTAFRKSRFAEHPRAVLRAGVTTAIVDGLFSSVLIVLYGSTFPRLWQGVAATLIGGAALAVGRRRSS
jgi:hypothetical protein